MDIFKDRVAKSSPVWYTTGKSTVDSIVYFRRSAEKYVENKRKSCTVFIDLEKDRTIKGDPKICIYQESVTNDVRECNRGHV